MKKKSDAGIIIVLKLERYERDMSVILRTIMK